MFAELVNKLAKTYQSDEAHPYFPRPSMAGPERCIRSMAYHGLGEPPAPFPGRSVLTMEDSAWGEELTVQWYERSVLRVHSRQMPVDLPAPGLNLKGYICKQRMADASECGKKVAPETIHGHIDWIVQPPTGPEHLVEHKALNHFGCQRIEKGELPMDNLTQACIYSAALQRDQPDLNRVHLVIKNKNTSQYIEFEMIYRAELDHLLIERMIVSNGDAPANITELNHGIEKPVGNAMEKFREVEKMVEKRRLPKRPYGFESMWDYPCGWCPWAGKCWENYDAEFAALSTDIALSGEIATAARFYKELGAQESEIKEQRDEVKATIKNGLRAIDAKAGRAGEYLIEVKRFFKKEFTVLGGWQEKLNIVKIKENKNGIHPNKKQPRKSNDQTAEARQDTAREKSD